MTDTNQGRVVSVRGSVVDIRFDAKLPPIYSLLHAMEGNNFGSYNKTYGSIGAAIALLAWMYASGFVILVGGEVNACMREMACEKAGRTDTKDSAEKAVCLANPKEKEMK